jgi:anti-sigma regulatory factor (Ser/Thr protein kinase)
MPLRQDSLGTLTDAVDARLASWGLDNEVINDARLVTEELGVNLIEYGRVPGHEAPPMELSLHLQDGSLQMQFRDQGVAFDPWAQPAPDLEGDLLERPIGGLGLHLVRNIATSVAYRREGNANVVGVILSASPTALDGAETA